MLVLLFQKFNDSSLIEENHPKSSSFFLLKLQKEIVSFQDFIIHQYENVIFFNQVKNDFLLWVIFFCLQKGPFPAEIAVIFQIILQCFNYILEISNLNTQKYPTQESFNSTTLEYWVCVQQGQSYLMGRMCLFSLGWPPF